MSGFIAIPDTPPPAGTDNALANDGFFPDMALTLLRDSVRVDGGVPDIRLRESALAAIAAINQRLAAYALAAQASGFATLAGVPATQIDGESRLMVLYRRAVCSLVKADLEEAYRDPDATAAGLRKADAMEPSIDRHRRDATWAIREMQGLPHTCVELI